MALKRRLQSFLSCLLLATLWDRGQATAVVRSAPARAPEAYATLVYGQEFVLAARVLGQSLRESGTTRDMVALTTGSLPTSSELTLASDGWRVIRVAPVENPAKGPQPTGFPPRFAFVYTKLYIFKLTEYKKVVFIDADVLVLRNMDAIFRCPGFCAALRHSERFNSGVMSLVPSVETYEDMMAKVATMPSYTGGDQGFLNSYFTSFAHAPLFDPTTSYTPDQYKYMRLPTTFNADVGLYVINSNRWMISREALYDIHFTLGPFKPWLWWSSWLVREDPTWHAVRARLPPDSRGIPAGRTPRQLFAERWMVAIPWAVAAAFVYLYWASLGPALKGALPACGSLLRTCRRSPAQAAAAAAAAGGAAATVAGRSGGGGGSSGALGADVVLRVTGSGAGGGGGNGSGCGGEVFPRCFMVGSLLAGYGCVLAVVITTILIVPPEVAPLYGWILSYEWGFMLLGLLYGAYLRSCFRAGRRAGPHPAVQVPKGLQLLHSSPLPVAETATSAAVLVAAILLAPWAGRLLGIRSFVGTIIATVFIGLGTFVVATVQFLFLPAQWYLAGRLAGSGARAA